MNIKIINKLKHIIFNIKTLILLAIIIFILYWTISTFNAILHQWGLRHFWWLNILQDERHLDEVVTFKYKWYSIRWNLKSSFIKDNTLYALYYYPLELSFFNKNDEIEEVYDYYKKYRINKEEINYNELPYYFIYNSWNNKYAYLNAKKEIIRWDLDKKSIDFNTVKKLDNSNRVTLISPENRINFDMDTKLEDMYSGRSQFDITANEYLNEMMKKY